jgi:hypothetical protein
MRIPFERSRLALSLHTLELSDYHAVSLNCKLKWGIPLSQDLLENLTFLHARPFFKLTTFL